MSQQKTLLSFFTKKSVPNTTPPEANNNLINKTDKVKAGLDQKSNANSCNSENGTGTATGTARQNGSLDVSNISHHDDDAVDTDSAKGKVYDEECKFTPGDIVWAKLEGFPWWPSLVCNHPVDGNHLRDTGKKRRVHVQFFSDPTERGWVKEKYVKKFTGSSSKEFQRGGRFYSSDSDCFSGALEADKALKMGHDERLQLVVAVDPSESEEEESDEESEADISKLDGDIFDAEMESDEEKDKENMEAQNNMETQNKTPNKTPKKSPKKRLTRSAAKPSKKRVKLMSPDSDISISEDEYKPVSSSSDDDDSSGEDEKNISEIDSGTDESPVKEPESRKRKQPMKKTCSTKKPNTTPAPVKSFLSPSVSSCSDGEKKTEFTPVAKKTLSKLASFSANETTMSTAIADGQEARKFTHLSHEFIWPANIKDAQKRKPDHVDYNPKTLYIPDSFLSQCTPAHRQWWDLKSKHYDTILFFKMGKFYELFHMDAVVAVNELGIIFMKGDHAHCGFPEISYGRYADTLIQKGYKVARIEQTETPDMMQERCKQMAKKCTKFDKVVKREICSIQTKGTKRYSFIDGDASSSESNYLLAICEKCEGADKTNGSTYGVCFIDTSIGKFHIGQFDDDRHGSRLRTLIAHYPPAHVLYERGKMSEKTQSILNNQLSSCLREGLRSGSEFWDGTATLKFLSQGEYFVDEDDAEKTMKWPKSLKMFLSKSDTLGCTPEEGYDMAVSSLGAVTCYLTDSHMDVELLTMKNFEVYIPVDVGFSTLSEPKNTQASFTTGRQHMVLDAVTLANLDVLENSSQGTQEGTLLACLNQCITPFGKRLFKQWLCAPLCNPTAINDRLDAVEDIMTAQATVAEVSDILKKLPDLERLLSKIHTLGSAHRSKNHPDGRAIFFENLCYSKRKIEDFLATLDGFKKAKEAIRCFRGVVSDFKSKLLKQTVTVNKNGKRDARFPDLTEDLDFFDNAFDHDKARTQGVINPRKGVNSEYDEALRDIKSIQQELDAYLDEQKKRLACRSLTYWGTAKNRFQIEVPQGSVKNLPQEFTVMSSKKTARRYHTPALEDMLARTMDAEDRRDAALKDTMRKIFFVFDKNYSQWEAGVQCLSVLDVLISLAHFSRSGDAICRPEFVLPDDDNKPFLEIREGRHPCISRTFSGGDFIPNDTVVGIKDENLSDAETAEERADSCLVLVTGPNMGGKSTLMRQVGIIAIIAQLGCYVPAEKCKMTPVDRVFTRLGASDRIMAGESTFFVELSETSSILQHATKHSLVLLDELGRGTATYDGTAIAYSVVQELSQSVGCRTLFSTHYHSLVDEFSHDMNVRLGHMACMVENENDEDPTQETITFLYKFVHGACPKSYGFNAARLANIPDSVIKTAVEKSRHFEDAVEKLRIFRGLQCLTADSGLQELEKLQRAIKVA